MAVSSPQISVVVVVLAGIEDLGQGCPGPLTQQGRKDQRTDEDAARPLEPIGAPRGRGMQGRDVVSATEPIDGQSSESRHQRDAAS